MTRSNEVPAGGPHGGDAVEVATALGLDPNQMVDLSASMNPFAPDVIGVLQQILAASPTALTRYPNPAAATGSLGVAIGIDPALLVLTNGGAEAIALVASELGSGHVVEPEFSLYRRHLPSSNLTAPRWRSNPSSPLGILAAPGEHAGVWDEAFYPLATGTWTRGDTDAWRLGSLTKLWSCPGLRLGYLIAPDPTSAERIRQRQPRWAVNGLALTSLPELLERTDLAGWHTQLIALRSGFAAQLATLGYAVRETDANWLLVERPGLRQQLAPLAVMVRDCTSFGLPDLHRVAVPNLQDLDRVLTAFAAVANRP